MYQSGIAKAAGLRLQQVQRALSLLVEVGVIAAVPDGNRVYYRPREESPLLPELRSLVVKTAGIADVVREALTGIPGVRLAFIFGSAAAGRLTPQSDVDVLVVGSAEYGRVLAALDAAEDRLGRAVNPMVYEDQEYARLLAEGHHFLARVLREPKIMLVGSEDDLGAVGRAA